ncbi:MAG: hypothetical protein ACRCST_17110 [Turicibacter sp.]
MNNELNGVPNFEIIKTFIVEHKNVAVFIIGILLILFAYPIGTILSTEIISQDAYGSTSEFDPEKAFYLMASFFLSGSLICIWAITRKSV